LQDHFVEKHPLDRKQIMEKVYNNPNPTLFLTSFTDFIEAYQSHPFIEEILKDGFRLFFQTYMVPLSEKYPGLPLNFTGSVAAVHEKLLRDVAAEHQLEIDQVINEPIHNLLNYYIKKT